MVLRCLLVVAIVSGFAQGVLQAEETGAIERAANSARSEVARLTVIGHIRAKLMDRKNIRSRYIRVRFDGQTLQLAGFVQSTNIAAEVEQIARSVAQPEKIETYWSVAEALLDHEPYTTHVGEQAEDFALWVKVKASLASPDLESMLKKVEVQAVDVDHGNVRVYLIADAPAPNLTLEPHVVPIAGVKSFSYRVLNAFAQVSE